MFYLNSNVGKMVHSIVIHISFPFRWLEIYKPLCFFYIHLFSLWILLILVRESLISLCTSKYRKNKGQVTILVKINFPAIIVYNSSVRFLIMTHKFYYQSSIIKRDTELTILLNFIKWLWRVLKPFFNV